MAEKETSKVNNEETKQESAIRVGDRLTLVHELIEVLAGSIALIAPAILLILWLYRVGICGFYNLPIFYSSLNIIRFLPVIIFAVLSLMYSWFLDGVHFSDIVDVWLFEYDGPVDLSKATTAEVAQIVWLNKEKIKVLLNEGELVDTLGYFFEISTF